MTNAEVDKIQQRIQDIRNEGRSLTRAMDDVIYGLKEARFQLARFCWVDRQGVELCAACESPKPAHGMNCVIAGALGRE